MASIRFSRLLSSSGTAILVRHIKIGQDEKPVAAKRDAAADESRIFLANSVVRQFRRGPPRLLDVSITEDEALELRQVEDGVVLPARTCGSCRTRERGL